MNDAAETLTRRAEALLLSASSFEEGLARLQGSLVGGSIREYFDALLARRGMTGAQAVRAADLDKDFGRQILQGERMTRRDNYLRLAFAMGLSVQEAQSMLNFLGMGPIYAVIERDAAILYALLRGYSLMDVQLLLDEQRLVPLGDADLEEEAPSQDAAPPPTRYVEHMVREARDYRALTEGIGDRFVRLGVAALFRKLLAARGLSRTQALDRAGLKHSIGFQLLNGTRMAKARDPYVRLAIGMGLTLPETQRMLKFLRRGELYPLKPRDAALVFCISRGFSLEQTQALLIDNRFPPL